MWVAARAMIAQRRVYFFALFECATAGAGPAVLGCSPSSHAVIPAISRKAMSAMVATARLWSGRRQVWEGLLRDCFFIVKPRRTNARFVASVPTKAEGDKHAYAWGAGEFPATWRFVALSPLGANSWEIVALSARPRESGKLSSAHAREGGHPGVCWSRRPLAREWGVESGARAQQDDSGILDAR